MSKTSIVRRKTKKVSLFHAFPPVKKNFTDIKRMFRRENTQIPSKELYELDFYRHSLQNKKGLNNVNVNIGIHISREDSYIPLQCS